MARTKTDKSVWIIFFEALKIFCLNIHKFLLYMSFPVLGQLVGIFLIGGLSFWFNSNLKALTEQYPIMNNTSTLSAAIIILALPGVLILVKAFWDYLVAYGALNSMTDGALTTGRIYDFPAHNAVVNSRKYTYIMLWLLFGIFTAIALLPLFWILGGIFFIYFILIFQVFTFEEGIPPVDYFKRSFDLIKGKFARTSLLLILLSVLAFFIFQGLTVLFEVLKFNPFMLGIFEEWAMTLPLDPINSKMQMVGLLITPNWIAHGCLGCVTSFIALGFTLPLRSIAWTLWYNNLNFELPVEKPVKKRKTTQKKLDKNILKRAMQDDEEY